jgi:cytochrome c553
MASVVMAGKFLAGSLWISTLLVSGLARADEGIDFFESKIRPVLVRECYECHSAEGKQLQGGLLLDHQAGMLKGGDSGPAVTPGKVEGSLLIAALRHEGFEMPPKGKLPDEVINDFVRWVEMGAPDPRTDAVTVATQGMTLEEAAEHWAFKPLSSPQLPSVQESGWVIKPIDHFVLARLEAEGLRPVRQATKREWLRRATFDLTGLPPAPEEIAAFLSDESDSAYETVLERLLGSPHYGERWGRHWLDVARYAEDQAHTFAVKPSTSGYRYRDWVIDALNDDMPFDRFVKLQIAADLIDLDPSERFRHLPALGFFGLGAQYYKNSDAERAKADELDDRVDTLSRGFLGLTVSCARCHDHKYDAIPTQDYYSLAGVFQSCRLDDAALVPQAEVQAYQASQERIKAADEAVKKFLADNKRIAAESHALRLADYAVAARALIPPADGVSAVKVEGDAIRKAAEEAKPNRLSPTILKRWVEWLASSAPAAPKLVQNFISAKGDEIPNAAAEVAEGLKLALDVRAGRVPAPKATDSATGEAKKHDNGTPRYITPVLSKSNPIVDIDIDLTDAKELHLVIADAGDGKSCDHADWIEPRLIGPDGPIKLTDLKWKSAETGYGSINIDRNVSGQPLKVGGTAFANGIGTHAPSVIVFDLPAGVTRFQCKAGVDNGGSDQAQGDESATVQFRVYTERPNDQELIMAGQAKPDQGVLGEDHAELVRWALADKGLFRVSDDELAEALDGETKSEWEKMRAEQKAAKEAAVPQYPVAHVIAEAQVADMPVFIRGNPARKGEVAPRKFLSLLASVAPDPFRNGSGRLELAEAIASPANPLTPRVFVNRVWQQHFGRGLVGTPSNFGALGERPSHPELLDHLAGQFVASGGSIKQLHRDIMLSATYRSSSDWDAKAAEIDGDNRLLWRMNRRRLDVEAWRDSLLSVSGKLQRTFSGPSTELDAGDNVRRTVYGKVSRHELNGLLRLFDFPDANITSERRSETTVPQQQLFVLNSPFMVEQAKEVAERFFGDAETNPEAQIRAAYEVLYGRPASEEEVALGLDFLKGSRPDGNEADKESEGGLTRPQRYAQVLLGANEFTFID